MIVDLPDTTTSSVSKALVKIREEGGAVALGRVLTLVISTELGHEEEAIEAANDASREHPMRVIVLSKNPNTKAHEDPRLDAQIPVLSLPDELAIRNDLSLPLVAVVSASMSSHVMGVPSDQTALGLMVYVTTWGFALVNSMLVK